MSDHWDLLEELADKLQESSEALRKFKESLDELPKHRKLVVSNTAESYILIQEIRKKISIMDGEWEEELASVKVKEVPKDIDFDSLEF